MGLGTNRDYVTRDRIAFYRLNVYEETALALQAAGVDEKTASKLAMVEAKKESDNAVLKKSRATWKRGMKK